MSANRFFNLFTGVVVVVAVLSLTAMQGILVKAEIEKPASVTPAYEGLVGKSLLDRDVAQFVAVNSCAAAYEYRLCEAMGIALEMDGDQMVQAVVLFPGHTNGFAAFHGDLPHGLHWNDSLVSVQEKLGVAPDAVFLNEAGLPNESGTPDSIRLWAVYNDLGLTIVYNTQSADHDNATIHAILVTK